MRPIPDPSLLTRPGDFLRVGVGFVIVVSTFALLLAIATSPLVDWGFWW